MIATILHLFVGAVGFTAEDFTKPRPPLNPSTSGMMILIGGALVLSVVAEIVARAMP